MVETICAYCGKKFKCQQWRLRERKHVFCCRECAGKYKSEHNPNYKFCEICGKKIKLKPYTIAKQKHFCCSYKCMGELRKQIYLGNENPNYNNRGSKNPLWKSDRKISNYGYVLIRKEDHPFNNIDGFVFEHRLVAEKYFLNDKNSVWINGQQYLSPDYIVHHKDHNRQNNSPDNLEIMTESEHQQLHWQEKLASLNSAKSVKSKQKEENNFA